MKEGFGIQKSNIGTILEASGKSYILSSALFKIVLKWWPDLLEERTNVT